MRMEAVTRFEIQLDVSDRQKMFDYGKSKMYQRPDEGQWDIKKLRQDSVVDGIDADDENTMLQIHNMDRVLLDKRWLEKGAETQAEGGGDSSESEENYFEEGEHLPQRVMPVYYPDEVVRGTLILETTEPIEAEKLVLKMRGRAGVSIRIYHPRGYYDHRGHEDYIKENVTFWEKSTSKKSSDVSDEFSLLSTSSGLASSKSIPPGKHQFPFDFKLPSSDQTCSSVPTLVPSTHNYAHVSFRLKAVIDKGKSFGRGNICTHRPIWLEKSFDIGKDKSNLQAASAQESLDTGVAFWKSGKITCNARVPRTVFLKGEDIPLTIEIDNQSKSQITSVTAKIVLGGKAKGGTSVMSPSMPINVKATKLKEGPLNPGMCPVINWTLPMDFRQSSVDNLLIPAGNLADCNLIDIKYYIKIELKRKGLHRNMELSIPIKVGTENSAEQYM
jgi:hypothetical protein